MEPVKLTDAEVRELNLSICSIEALDEHVAKQIKARGELLNQKKDWWDKILKKYEIGKGDFHFNRLDGCIHSNVDITKSTQTEGQENDASETTENKDTFGG